MTQPDHRHFAPLHRAWDADEAMDGIEEIVDDALEHLHPDSLWPAHPDDEDVPDGHGSIYFGAAGVIWALHRLGTAAFEGPRSPDSPPRDVAHAPTEPSTRRRAGTPRVPAGIDHAGLLGTALRRNAPWFAEGPYPAHASLLFGDLGILLARMRVAPSEELADTIHARIAANESLPTVELMWGLAGSMLACVSMRTMTEDARFEHRFRAQATRLLAELDDTDDGRLWTQDLYGQRLRLLSAVHGFAGNALALLRGWDWLDAGQRASLAEFVPRTLAATAVPSGSGVNWPQSLPASRPIELCQHCHGAPGIVTALADAPFSTPSFENLLVAGGEHVWEAGPLRKGGNLCHGTAGNGYAFLKLYRRTGDRLWLDRARCFAMVALDQVRERRSALGRGRFSLWTGDIGTALYLRGCITGNAAFPTIDVF